MDIIKKGRRLNSSWYGKCKECDTIVKASIDELSVRNGDYRTDNERYAWAKCPACGECNGICFHEDGTKSVARLLRETLPEMYADPKPEGPSNEIVKDRL